jgi:hypothetical protein
VHLHGRPTMCVCITPTIPPTEVTRITCTQSVTKLPTAIPNTQGCSNVQAFERGELPVTDAVSNRRRFTYVVVDGPELTRISRRNHAVPDHCGRRRPMVSMAVNEALAQLSTTASYRLSVICANPLCWSNLVDTQYESSHLILVLPKSL